MLMRSYGFGRMFSPGRLLLTASASTSSTTTSSSNVADGKLKLMPVTVLSGFLGAGKTSFLQHVIGTSDESKRKYGLVVNDMATVNVDSKLIKAQSGSFDGIDTMELQNGCVCCTLAEDLMASVSRLVSLSEAKGVGYDHIVVECSGIAEPRKIRELFQEAEDLGSSLTARIKLDTLITLVDATVFLDLYGSADADLDSYSQLAVAEDDVEGQAALANEGSGQRRVTELLLEQVECADVVLINKCDLLKRPGDEALVRKIIASINPTARVLTSVRGVLQGADAAIGDNAGQGAPSLLGSAGGEGAASWGVLDEHRRVVAAVNQANCDGGATCKDPTHDHDHSHSHSHSHEHEHEHEHKGGAEAAACSNPTCNDPTHDHSHSHSHDHVGGQEACDGGATCNDPTHNHDHSHSHDHSQATTALDRFGITSFVYQRRRPFHPARFSLFLQSLGKLSVDGIAELSEQPQSPPSKQEEAAAGPETTPLAAARRALLRSKGFVWMGTSSAAAYFMSHAGQYLELVVLGRWWADIPKSEWPAGSESEITVDFSGQYGDRRQELVFIGQFAGVGGKSQQALEEVLDTCLLTDEEMAQYEATVNSKKGDEALRRLFFPTP
jgi:G3E family GTPase